MVWWQYVSFNGKKFGLCVAVLLQNVDIICYYHFQPEFYAGCHTKEAYEEYGPGICRHNPVFGTML